MFACLFNTAESNVTSLITRFIVRRSGWIQLLSALIFKGGFLITESEDKKRSLTAGPTKPHTHCQRPPWFLPRLAHITVSLWWCQRGEPVSSTWHRVAQASGRRLRVITGEEAGCLVRVGTQWHCLWANTEHTQSADSTSSWLSGRECFLIYFLLKRKKNKCRELTV